MAIYMAMRIAEEAFGPDSYMYVYERRPDLKPGIDEELIRLGREDLIVNIE